MQNTPPNQFRYFDHTGIGQEFFQKSPHGWGSRFIRRTEIDQYDRCLRAAAVGVRWFGIKAHGVDVMKWNRTSKARQLQSEQFLGVLAGRCRDFQSTQHPRHFFDARLVIQRFDA
jgi:hypothetical protein